MTGGRWTFCAHCGSIGYVDWGYQLHGEIGTCPNPNWRGMGEEVTDRAAEECERLNDLEDAAAPTPIDFEDLANTREDDDDPYSAFAYRGGFP